MKHLYLLFGKAAERSPKGMMMFNGCNLQESIFFLPFGGINEKINEQGEPMHIPRDEQGNSRGIS